jgi:HlyD family secretion protein
MSHRGRRGGEPDEGIQGERHSISDLPRHGRRRGVRRGALFALLCAVLLAGAVLAVGAISKGISGRGRSGASTPVEVVARRDIALTIEASGVVEAIDLVEVKSKASGQILRMPVEVGSRVRAGDLIAQIDTVDVQNSYEQADAARKAAQAKADVAEAQLKRADILYSQQVTTITEHESALLASADAEAQLVKARTDLDTARQRRDDATVRAPISGTVLEQLVSTGQVISSATASVSGGTSLLKMADLSRIRVRAYVSETDIGKVRTGQEADVSFEAYSTRTFAGKVEKVEPQAVVQQSVTMFPVLISIANEDGLLLPGMNGDVSMVVDKRSNVSAVSLDAVRELSELVDVAAALGMNADSIQARIRRGMSPPRFGPGPESAPPPRTGTMAPPQIAFVRNGQDLEPRLVHLGLSDYDYAEVLEGLKDGESVALLSVAELQAQRSSDQARIRARMGNGIPGSTGTKASSGSASTSGSDASTGSSSGGSSTRTSSNSKNAGGDGGPPPPPMGGP